MQLHQLRYAVTIAEEGSFTQAAEKLLIAQPSLSVQIKKLEQELGVRLFERHGRRAVPTSVGELFLARATHILAQVTELRDQMRKARDVHLGKVALGVLPSVGTGLLPGVLRSYRQAHPRIEITTVEQDLDASAEFQRRVYRGELDLAVVRASGNLPSLTAELLLAEPIGVLFPPGHALGEQNSASLNDLVEEEFVALRSGGGLRTLMNEMCDRAGFSPNVAVETGQLSMLWRMVNVGMGVAVVPRLAAGDLDCWVALRDPFARRELRVIWRSSEPLSPSARAFREVLFAHAAQWSNQFPPLPTR
ncbi:LysR family transcriptional regulator [Pseudonocardia spinosispora]|uniref:LysR family transcriptional regulator n=1 Tax=Pseudonocardia spinosispora TaxID=103441 RepID=UPI0003FA2FA4|nr:LysR family transcriptional regulator [Pseudonocardia spinosispora]